MRTPGELLIRHAPSWAIGFAVIILSIGGAVWIARQSRNTEALYQEQAARVDALALRVEEQAAAVDASLAALQERVDDSVSNAVQAARVETWKWLSERDKIERGRNR